jgi:hypothetical protein
MVNFVNQQVSLLTLQIMFMELIKATTGFQNSQVTVNL